MRCDRYHHYWWGITDLFFSNGLCLYMWCDATTSFHDSAQVMEFEVFDHDNGPSDDDALGSCQLPLSVLMADVESSHNIPLSNTKTGSLLLKAT